MEHLFVKVGIGKSSLIVGAVYIVPKATPIYYESFGESLESITDSNPDSRIFVFGDFNLPRLTFTNNRFNCCTVAPPDALPHVRDAAPVVNRFCSLLSLFQCNFLRNFNNVCLDLVFSSTIVYPFAIPPLLRLDNHHPVFITNSTPSY